MGVSIGAATDYLVAGLAAPLVVVDSTAIVVDGIATDTSQSMVYVGKRDPNQTTAAEGNQQLMVLGAGRSAEEYEIPCVVWVARPGPTIKPARDAAIALFDVVARFIASDRTLGGVLLQGRIAEISVVTLDQDIADDTGSLFVAWLSFAIHCKNHYIP